MSSPSIYIRGMMEVDDKYEVMVRLKKTCEEANINYPQELFDYFGQDPDEGEYELKVNKFGVNILAIDTGGGLYDWATNYDLIESKPYEKTEDRIYDIHLDKLPQSLKTLRVEVSW